MAESFRDYDSDAEREIGKFLDRYFYSKEEIKDFRRFKDREEQLKGKDTTFTWGELKKIIVDEKAQVYYVNENIPTFAFEIDFLRRGGQLTPGWLFDPTKQTQYYLLIWITADEEHGFKEEDIRKLDCLLIKREDIIVYLSDESLSVDKIKEIAQKIRADGTEGWYFKGDYDSCYFYLSSSLAEQPLNIIIHRRKLQELAVKAFSVERH
jgi:hypothetical protein